MSQCEYVLPQQGRPCKNPRQDGSKFCHIQSHANVSQTTAIFKKNPTKLCAIFKTLFWGCIVAPSVLAVHVIALRMYVNMCVPLGFQALWTVASPPCTALLHITSRTSELYISAWAIIVVSVVSMAHSILTILRK